MKNSIYALNIIKCKQYEKLLQKSAFDDEDTNRYLNSRNLYKEDFERLNIEVFSYEGEYIYNNKKFTIPKSIVIPLKEYYKDDNTINEFIIGLWIRSITSKQFLILTDFTKLFYTPDCLDPNNEVYIFESILDAISFSKVSKHTAVASCLGLNPQHLIFHLDKNKNKKLVDNNINQCYNISTGKGYVSCLDNDLAGYKSTLNIINNFEDIKVLILDKVKDFNELIQYNNPERYYNILNPLKAHIIIKQKL